MNLVFKQPDKTTPGYLRRTKKAMRFAQTQAADFETPEMLEELIEFMADYIIEPEKKEDKIEALLDASEEQFNEMIGALSGGGASTVPPENKLE